MNYKIIDYLTFTVTANSPQYVFEIAISQLKMDEIKHKELLGGFIRLQKSKYEFLNDLRDVLAEEILTILEKLGDEKAS